MILFECPGMIGLLDSATLARRRIIPFWGQERYNSRISEQKNLNIKCNSILDPIWRHHIDPRHVGELGN